MDLAGDGRGAHQSPPRWRSLETQPRRPRQGGGKRSLPADANRIPLGVVCGSANLQDVKRFEPALEVLRVLPPVVPQHLCLDKGYDSTEVRETAWAHLFTPHIQLIGEEPRRMERKRKPRR